MINRYVMDNCIYLFTTAAGKDKRLPLFIKPKNIMKNFDLENVDSLFEVMLLNDSSSNYKAFGYNCEKDLGF